MGNVKGLGKSLSFGKSLNRPPFTTQLPLPKPSRFVFIESMQESIDGIAFSVGAEYDHAKSSDGMRSFQR